MNPCYQCVERIFGCHATCAKYIAWRSEHTALRERIHEEKEKERTADEQRFKKRSRK